jgi:hypothetical protein
MDRDQFYTCLTMAIKLPAVLDRFKRQLCDISFNSRLVGGARLQSYRNTPRRQADSSHLTQAPDSIGNSVYKFLGNDE